MSHGPTMRLMLTVIAAAVLSVPQPFTAAAWADEEFAEIRKAVRDDSSNDDKHHRRPHGDDWTWAFRDDCDDDDDDESLAAKFIGPLVAVTISGPFLIPHKALYDDFYNDAYFPLYPYDEGPGYLIVEPPSSQGMRTWGGRVTGQYGDNFSDISHWSGRLQLDTQSRFGFDGEWYFRREDLSGGVRDELSTGDANLTFRFAQNEFAEFHTGVGANWLTDDADTDWGVNFTYGVDVFPAQPWVLSSTLDLGTVGHASLIHFRGTAGLLIGGAELFTGYDLFRAGDTHINALIAGVRIWF